MNALHRTFLLLPLLVGLPLLASPINYVTDGDFETGGTSGVLSPSVPGDLIYVFGVGGVNAIGPWSVTAGPNSNGSTNPLSVLVTGDPPQQPAGGSYAVDFDPFWNISTGALLGPTVTGTLPEISQTFLLPAGTYLLSFEGAVEEGVLPQTRPLTVTLSGAATLNQTVTTNETDSVGYTLFSFAFDSTGGSVTLTFIPNDFSAEPNFMLDNVSVTAVPEPALALPVLAVLLLFGLRGRPRPRSRKS